MAVVPWGLARATRAVSSGILDPGRGRTRIWITSGGLNGPRRPLPTTLRSAPYRARHEETHTPDRDALPVFYWTGVCSSGAHKGQSPNVLTWETGLDSTSITGFDDHAVEQAIPKITPCLHPYFAAQPSFGSSGPFTEFRSLLLRALLYAG